VFPRAHFLLKARQLGFFDTDEIIDEAGTKGGSQRRVLP
jgi:hypothetical protein